MLDATFGPELSERLRQSLVSYPERFAKADLRGRFHPTEHFEHSLSKRRLRLLLYSTNRRPPSPNWRGLIELLADIDLLERRRSPIVGHESEP
ncbi:MAG: hypothetical protein NXI31_05945 [bacterium]|nr:hypothetical protein [bacterium]